MLLYDVGDTDAAAREFAAVLRSQPSNADAWRSLARAQEANGRLNDALANGRRAADLDPRSIGANVDAAFTAWFLLRDHAEAARYFDRAIAASADSPVLHLYRASLDVHLGIGAATAGARLREAVTRFGVSRVASTGWLDRALLSTDRSVAAAVGRLTLSDFSGHRQNYCFTLGEAAAARGDSLGVRVYYDSLRVVLEPTVRAQPRDAELRAWLAIAYAYAGRKQDALNAADRAMRLSAGIRDAYVITNVAKAEAIAGESDAAIDKLTYLLTVPSIVSVANLRADPDWNPLRSHPRFQRLHAGQ